MANRVIVSLAILKANADEHVADHLDSFLPFVAECIRTSEDDDVSVATVRNRVAEEFKLHIPLSAVEAILSRLCKRHYLEKKGISSKGLVYTRDRSKLAGLNFREIQREVERKHAALLRSLIEYCHQQFGVVWSPDQADEALEAYFDEGAVQITSAALNGTELPLIETPLPSKRFLVGSFVRHLNEAEPAGFEYLVTVTKGHMLASALFLEIPNSRLSNFKRTEVYLDTSFLMWALGCSGEVRQAPCLELIQMLKDTGAQLRCFRHNEGEIRTSLFEAAKRIRTHKVFDTYGALAETVSFFTSEGYEASDVELMLTQLDSKLEGLGVRVVETPSYANHRYTIDEEEFARLLRERFQSQTQEALERDVKSVSAIMRLRMGQEFHEVEKCRAVFVTTNNSLARETKNYFSKGASSGAVSPCLSDRELTVILWLKSPLHAPELPRKRIIADCYAATQPSDRLWRRFITEVDKLERQGTATAEDYYALRYSPVTRDALMEETLGEEGVISQDTVVEVLRHIKASMTVEVQANLERERELRTAAEEHARKAGERLASEVAEAVRQSTERLNLAFKEHAEGIVNETRQQARTEALGEYRQRLNSRIDKEAKQFAKLMTATIRASVIGIVLICTLVIILVPSSMTTLQVVGGIVTIATLIAGAFAWLFGTPILPKTRPIAERIEEWRRVRLRKLANVEWGEPASKASLSEHGE